MDPEIWQRAEELFLECQLLDGEARSAHLRRATSRLPEVRRLVEVLLAAEDLPDDWIERSIGHAFLNLRAPREPQRRIGPYRLLRAIGHGGLSTVHLAERQDQYRQYVALKLVRRELASDDLLRRIRQERQILARLEHPNIARLLDGGTTDDGLPYFVMEHIDGQPIDVYCARQRLGLQQRLSLFRQVCVAVHFAHQNLVIHRDIKPANLLVTTEGLPKLLDFGIAKLLDPEVSGAQEWAATATGLRLLTPEYASPEQIEGLPLTTATDVYSLGVLLYRLLTAESPYRLARGTSSELLTAICHQDPPRPSAALADDERPPAGLGPSLPRWRRQLAGDLDNIVLKALHKEPGRRYASVEQLAEDIDRHLTNQPIKARPDTVIYRTARFVRRHRLAVVASALVFFTLIGAAMVTDQQAREALRERARAEKFLELAVGMIEAGGPGEDMTVRQLVDRMSRSSFDDLADEPETQAMLLHTLARMYQELGAYGRAADLFAHALELRRARLGEAHPQVADSLNGLGEARFRQGRFNDADEMFIAARAIRTAHFGSEHVATAEVSNNLAAIAFQRADYPTARKLFREALDIHRRSLGDDERVTAGLDNLAVVEQALGDYAAAEVLLRQALELREQRLAQHDDRSDDRSDDTSKNADLADSYSRLAAVLQLQGKLEPAARLYRQALAIYRDHFGEEHPQVARSSSNLASLLLLQNELTEAEELIEQALASTRQTLGDDHLQLTYVLNIKADLLRQRAAPGDLKAAEALYRGALALRRQRLPTSHPRLAYSLIGLAHLLLDQQRDDEACVLVREARHICRRSLPDTHPLCETAARLAHGCREVS